jgi:hypothetical protein
MKTFYKFSYAIFFVFRYVMPGMVIVLATRALVHPSATTFGSIGVLIAVIGLLLVANSFELKSIHSYEDIKRDMKMVEYQELILKEMQYQNDRIFKLHTANANALSKMTTLANQSKETN